MLKSHEVEEFLTAAEEFVLDADGYSKSEKGDLLFDNIDLLMKDIYLFYRRHMIYMILIIKWP